MCRVRRVGVTLLVAVLVFGSLTVPPAGATAHRSLAPGVGQLGDAGIEPDGVLMRADVRADGDARWTVEYRVRLNDENTTAAFESLRDDIETNETAYTSTFADRMRATARAAANATGREMTIQNVSVRATRRNLPQEYGVVTYQFEWTGFAVADANTLEAGDALAGLFLDRQTTFVVGWPDAYATTAVQPTPDERRDDAVVWVGPTDFADGEPAVSLSTTASETAVGGGDATAGVDDGATDEAGGGDGPSPLTLLAGAFLLAVGVAGALLWRRSQGSVDGGRGDVTSASETAPGAGGEAAATAESDARPYGVEAAGGDTDTDTDADADAEEDERADTADDERDGEGTAAPWEDDLLSNEERVLALLDHHDGRMKQQAVAAELDWSDAKTSQVIGKLRDAEEVETFRLGRENVVALPGSGLT